MCWVTQQTKFMLDHFFLEAIMMHKICTLFFICIPFYPNFIKHMTKDCRFEYGYNISEIHHQKEIISENTSQKKQNKTTKTQGVSNALYNPNIHVLPTREWWFTCIYNQCKLTTAAFFIFTLFYLQKLFNCFYLQYNYMLVERLNT